MNIIKIKGYFKKGKLYNSIMGNVWVVWTKTR